MEEIAIPGGRLDRMAERVAEIEHRTPGRVALVGQDDLDLRPRGSLDDFRDRAAVERGRVTLGDRLALRLEQLEQPLVAEGGHLRRLAERGPEVARRKRTEKRDVGNDGRRLVERPDEVFALGKVDSGLAADRAVDLGEERRRDLDERDAAKVGRGEEPGRVTERAPSDRDQRLTAFDPPPGELARRLLDDRQPLCVLTLGKEELFDGPPAVRQAVRDGLAGRRQCAGLRDEDRAPGPEALERLVDRLDRLSLAQHKAADPSVST